MNKFWKAVLIILGAMLFYLLTGSGSNATLLLVLLFYFEFVVRKHMPTINGNSKLQSIESL